jgi:hypothetical protein
MAGTNRNTQQPRRQEQQQEAPQKRPRRQHSSTAASAPSIQVSEVAVTSVFQISDVCHVLPGVCWTASPASCVTRTRLICTYAYLLPQKQQMHNM